MNCLDFLSEPPKNYIFQKGQNKTHFGGTLFFIYIFIMALISLAYIIDYCLNEKYLVEYSKVNNIGTAESRNEFNEDPELNPLLDFELNITDQKGNNLSERFVFYDIDSQKFISRDVKKITKKVSNFNIYIFYKCEDSNCTKNEEDYTYFTYYINLIYPSFIFQHQNDSSPIRSYNISKYINYCFGFNFLTGYTLNWKVVKYKSVKGISRLWDYLINKKNEYITGYFSSSYFNIMDNSELLKINGSNYKLISIIKSFNSHNDYEEYKRKKIGILDVISKIGALFSTFKFLFSLCYKYYSKNFDNYKILEDILFNKMNKSFKKEDTKNIELISNKKDFGYLEENNPIENKISINDSDNNENEVLNDNNSKHLKYPKKIGFFQFFINNLNIRNCIKTKEQDIITTCNKILLKYFSIENILFNQMKLENLYKDYKWNNPKLSEINNNLIIKLTNLLELT